MNKNALPVIKAPKHTERRIIWNKTTGVGHAILLVGYCPQTLPYYLGLVEDLLKTFPTVEQEDIFFGHVTQSNTVKGFTILMAPVSGPKRKISGYTEWDSIDFNY
jgi:hypothetical protein